MRNWQTYILVLITIIIFWFIKFQLQFPNADTEIIGIVLSVASILFGLLAGFFISELCSRYTEIREMQGERNSEELNMIQYARYFFSNKAFKKEFIKKVEQAEIADQIIAWDEGHLEIPHYRSIETSFKKVNIKNKKDEIYFDNLMDSYNNLIKATVRMDTLYKDRLFASEWMIIIVLSLIISVTVLFLDSTTFFMKLIILVFPAIITLSLVILHNLDKLVWGRELLTLDPSQKVFDAIGVKRFYRQNDIKYITEITDYRTEKDLKGDLKQILLDITKQRN